MGQPKLSIFHLDGLIRIAILIFWGFNMLDRQTLDYSLKQHILLKLLLEFILVIN